MKKMYTCSELGVAFDNYEDCLNYCIHWIYDRRQERIYDIDYAPFDSKYNVTAWHTPDSNPYRTLYITDVILYDNLKEAKEEFDFDFDM